MTGGTTHKLRPSPYLLQVTSRTLFFPVWNYPLHTFRSKRTPESHNLTTDSMHKETDSLSMILPNCLPIFSYCLSIWNSITISEIWTLGSWLKYILQWVQCCATTNSGKSILWTFNWWRPVLSVLDQYTESNCYWNITGYWRRTDWLDKLSGRDWN